MKRGVLAGFGVDWGAEGFRWWRVRKLKKNHCFCFVAFVGFNVGHKVQVKI